MVPAPACAGTYFRNNIWWWHPLADYIEMIAADEAAGCSQWHSNEGDGLDEAGALRLADKLQREIDNGRCLRYAASRGTIGNNGTTSAEANIMVEALVGAVSQLAVNNAANLETSVDGNWPFSVENVQELVTFLRHSGGFEIC